MEFDWKSVVKGIAPILGTALLGPFGGGATKLIAEAVLGNPNAPEQDISNAVKNSLDPESVERLRKADNDFKVRLEELKIDLAKLNAATEQAYITDVQDARKAHSANIGVFWLGIAIIAIFALTMSFVLYGSYLLLIGTDKITLEDGYTSTLAGLVGAVVGYIAANAQQVVGYFFGSSKGSNDKTAALTDAVSKAIKG